MSSIRRNMGSPLAIALAMIAITAGEAAAQNCCAVGMARPEDPDIPLTLRRKQAGEEFTSSVSGERCPVAEATPATEYRGRTYYFCSREEKEAFLRNPDRYASRGR